MKFLEFNNSKVEDLTPLAGLKALKHVNAKGTKVTDWAPLDHVDNVTGRPKNWKRKAQS